MHLDRLLWTWHAGRWHRGNVPILGSADHGTWLGNVVFDGARRFEGVTPDLAAHAVRVNQSARALGMRPTLQADEIVSLVEEGLERFPLCTSVYIRPMYWSREFGAGIIVADPDSTDFSLCLEALPMPEAGATTTLCTTRYRRPTLDVATVDAKAACLYPNNARMMREAQGRGFSNAIVTDCIGNIAESATSNVFMVRDGVYYTPVPNGTFLNGITRQRIIALLLADGAAVHESSLTLDDFLMADEVFLSGNYAKITPVTRIEQTSLTPGRGCARVRELYWDWALSSTGDPALER